MTTFLSYIHADGTPCDIPRTNTLTADRRQACEKPEGRVAVKCAACGEAALYADAGGKWCANENCRAPR